MHAAYNALAPAPYVIETHRAGHGGYGYFIALPSVELQWKHGCAFTETIVMHHTISLRDETIKLNIRNGVVVSGTKPSELQREVSRITQRLLLLA